MAGGGGDDLNGFPAMGRWLQRVADLSGHIPITTT
jgi:hypothetical protein